MAAYLSKSDVSEGFHQIIDFLNGSSIKYALTMNPNIYVSCIKQFWTTVAVKQVNDVTRLQTLVDRKKVVIREATIREALRLDDEQGADHLPNEESFAELARMRYEKPSTKLTFYKAFFSSQWKVETPLFEGMLIEQQVDEEEDADENVEEVNAGDAAEGYVQQTPPQSPQVQPPSPQPQQAVEFPMNLLQERAETSDETMKDDVSNQGRMIAKVDADDDVVLEDVKKAADEAKEVSEDAKVDENVDIHGRQAESQAKIYKIDFDQANKVLSMQEGKTKPAEVQEVVDVVTTDEQYARELHAELNKNIDWDEVIDHMKIKAKEDPAMKKYQALKRKPKTESQASKNMMLYLKNVAGFKMDYFKGMSYDDIRPIFEAKFNLNVAFLLKTKEQIEKDENRALQRLNETPTERAAKRQKLDEEVEELKRHLQIVPNKDDDVYTEATPLARKVPVIDYQINELNNKPTTKSLELMIYTNSKVKGWKLLESCGVQIITFTSTQLILLVERKYPLTRFTLDQLLNAVRLKVEEESEVSLEFLRFIRQQHQEGQQE
nr:hypothetical protein [Tanacetum cinerariifolium]